MICAKNIHRTTKYFLLILLIHCHLCFAQDDAVQKLEEEDRFLQLSASRRPYNMEQRSSSDYQPERIAYKADSQYFKTIFFVVLGLGLAIFVSLLFVCFKVATVFEINNTPPIVNTRVTFNNNTGVPLSHVNTAYATDYQESDRPPDYATVTTTDSVHRNATFPQVVITHMETPPPKYEDGPVFR